MVLLEIFHFNSPFAFPIQSRKTRIHKPCLVIGLQSSENSVFKISQKILVTLKRIIFDNESNKPNVDSGRGQPILHQRCLLLRASLNNGQHLD